MTQGDAPVFWEKVRTPDPRGLTRRRLEERLLGPDAPSTGLVLGPPGSGKTTLLSWVAAHTPAPCAWYRAEAEDTDEAALARHLAHALQGTHGPRPGWDEVDDVGGLVEALQQRDDPVVVVLDDVHELAGQPAERALERFVRLRPRHVRLLLGSRRPPAVNVSRLLVSGDLVQLDAEDLRFRSWETEELFRAVYREPLSPETAAALTRRTGGWAAGLQLFHLGSGGLSRTERERAVAELSGRSRLIRSYLTRNVLSGLDEARRRFLLHTSTLGVLTGETCDELLGETGSAAVLDELEQQHFFTSSLDDGRTFRYHQVLQTHLEVVLADEVGEEAVRALYARSAALLERSGRVGAAVRAYARAEDWGSVARLVPGSPTLQVPEDALGPLGVDLDDPGLLVARARRFLVNGQLPEAVEAFRRAEASMDDLDFRARCAADRRLALVFTAAPPGLSAGATPAPALRLAAELRAASLDLRGREALVTGLGRATAGLLAGDLAACREGLALAQRERVALPVAPLALALLAELCDALTEQRPPSLAALDEVVGGAESAGLPWVARLARGLQAAALLLRDPSEGHAAACADLLDDGDQHGDPWSQVLVAAAVGAAALLTGAEGPGTQALGRAREAAAAVGAPVLAVWADVLLGPRATAGRARPAADEVARRARALGVEVPAGLRDGLRRWDGGPAQAERGAGQVALRTLGGFGLEVDGQEVAWAGLRPRAQSLLMMLAAHHGRLVHRERLVDALWPDVALGPGVRSLQVAVSSIRHCLADAGLGDGALDRRGEAYLLRLPGCDDQRAAFEGLVHDAEREVAGGDLRAALVARTAALARYGGDLLPEAGPAEWVVVERSRLASTAVRAATGAAELALQTDEVPTAIAAATRAVELDPYSDVGWQLLGRAHERNGDPTAAAMVRRQHERVTGELGLGIRLPARAGGRAPGRLTPPARTSRGVRAPA